MSLLERDDLEARHHLGEEFALLKHLGGVEPVARPIPGAGNDDG